MDNLQQADTLMYANTVGESYKTVLRGFVAGFELGGTDIITSPPEFQLIRSEGFHIGLYSGLATHRSAARSPGHEEVLRWPSPADDHSGSGPRQPNP
jgi:hypothetical protein